MFNVTTVSSIPGLQAVSMAMAHWPCGCFGISLSRVISMRARPKLANRLGLASGKVQVVRMPKLDTRKYGADSRHNCLHT